MLMPRRESHLRQAGVVSAQRFPRDQRRHRILRVEWASLRHAGGVPISPTFERHRGRQAGWLRAAVLGADDGIVSTASLMLGVAASHASHSAILTAGLAALAAGAMAMAAGEFVSVSSQRDVERADLRTERLEHAANPAAELDELYRDLSGSWSRSAIRTVLRLPQASYCYGRIVLADYDGPLRQVIATDLGHEEPTILLTNQLTKPAAKLVGRYAQRMIIENSIADGIDFFHIDALSSAVAMKVNCDLQLTLMASSLYRLLAGRIGRGYEHAESRHLFQDFVDATAKVKITESEIVVRYQKRAHNPLLVAAGFERTETVIPWLGGKRLQLVFG